jgi:uncharacterized MnhB-related membrane protein
MLYLFYLFAAVSVIAALAVVLARSPVNSVIALIVCFLSIAGHYILLNAQFLAMVHIIVYTGAIMVLFLFVIMLLNMNRQTEPEALVARVFPRWPRRVVPVGAAGAIRKGWSGAVPGERLRPRHRAGAQRGHVPLHRIPACPSR